MTGENAQAQGCAEIGFVDGDGRIPLWDSGMIRHGIFVVVLERFGKSYLSAVVLASRWIAEAFLGMEDPIIAAVSVRQ